VVLDVVIRSSVFTLSVASVYGGFCRAKLELIDAESFIVRTGCVDAVNMSLGVAGAVAKILLEPLTRKKLSDICAFSLVYVERV